MILGMDGKELGEKKPKQVPLNITMDHLATILTALDYLIEYIDTYKDVEGAPLDVLDDANGARTHIHDFLSQGEVKH